MIGEELISARLADAPECLLTGALTGIADVPDGEQVCQLRALETVIGRAADAPESGKCFLATLKLSFQTRTDARSRIREAVRAKYATSIHHIKIFRAMCDRGTDRAPA